MASSQIFLSIFWALSWGVFAQSEIPLSGRIVDNAGLLKPAEVEELDKYLAEYEASTTNQIVVVTLKSLDTKNIEEFGYELGRRWGIGTKREK